MREYQPRRPSARSSWLSLRCSATSCHVGVGGRSTALLAGRRGLCPNGCATSGRKAIAGVCKAAKVPRLACEEEAEIVGSRRMLLLEARRCDDSEEISERNSFSCSFKRCQAVCDVAVEGLGTSIDRRDSRSFATSGLFHAFEISRASRRRLLTLAGLPNLGAGSMTWSADAFRSLSSARGWGTT